ncbi:hypothetical protein THS27_25085 [Thalassospira sp. MCCC 1A01428]|nr:hypothetical protein THS27_25085 [Thalassospira sp. MCCC 1A01428]
MKSHYLPLKIISTIRPDASSAPVPGFVRNPNVQVSEAAAEGGSAATQVLASARELSKSASDLRTQMSTFVEKVRAA